MVTHSMELAYGLNSLIQEEVHLATMEAFGVDVEEVSVVVEEEEEGHQEDPIIEC